MTTTDALLSPPVLVLGLALLQCLFILLAARSGRTWLWILAGGVFNASLVAQAFVWIVLAR